MLQYLTLKYALKDFHSLPRDFAAISRKILTPINFAPVLGICSRLGAGRLRHMEVRYLWLQMVVQRRHVSVMKCKGDDNLADIGTKILDGPRFELQSSTLYAPYSMP